MAMQGVGAGVVCALLGLGPAAAAGAQAAVPANAVKEERRMHGQAKGTFEVKMTPLPKDEKVAGLAVARYGIAKQFRGDLEGTSALEMMAPDSKVEGSGGYVAVEQITGTLDGRAGSFTVIHQATMKGNANFDISIKVVPDSGTDGLTGIEGAMRIVIEGRKHSYELDYSLPEAR